jgi:hypothetical protein
VAAVSHTEYKYEREVCTPAPGEATAALTQGDCDNAAFVTLFNATDASVDFVVNGETVPIDAKSQRDVEVAFGTVDVTIDGLSVDGFPDEAVAPQGCNTTPPPPDDNNPPTPNELPHTL